MNMSDCDNAARRLTREAIAAIRKALEAIGVESDYELYQEISTAIALSDNENAKPADQLAAWDEAHGACSFQLAELARAMVQLGVAMQKIGDMANMCAEGMREASYGAKPGRKF